MFRLTCTFLLVLVAANGQQVLYNGIRLPEVWPPRDLALTNEPIPEVPYLVRPPAVIPIDVGRQLFVDDFLIEQTDLCRQYHQPELYPGNPTFDAMSYSGGLFYDPRDQLFKFWYGGAGEMRLATSRDGVHWEKPNLDVKPGTNAVQIHPNHSSTVWLDLDEKDPGRRYKMGYTLGHNMPFVLFVSADGVHWSPPVAQSVPSSDRCTFFKNPFRNVWVASLRDHDWTPTTTAAVNWVISDQPPEKYRDYIGRFRRYWESPEFETMVSYKSGEQAPSNPRLAAPLWAMADRLDPRRVDLNAQPELYNLDAVAYESLMLGLFTIWPGNASGSQKMNYLTVGYSRDGFHWSRPDRQAFIAPTGRHGDWNHANIQSVGGVCLVVGDRLYFYFSGRAGVPGKRAASGASTGLATMRRDGFASMDSDGTPRFLTTRPVRFTGKRLFVNIDSTAGEMRVEVLDTKDRALRTFSADNCIPLRTDNTLAEVRWRGVNDLSGISDQPVKFRFRLRNARLFAFWVSPDERGSSNGYVAAGGPGFTSARDTEGTRSYRFCCRPTVW